MAVKGLIDFRRLADDETDLVLAILIVEDIAIAFVLAFAGGGGGGVEDSLALAFKAITFIVVSLAASRWLARPIDRLLEWMPREFFLLFTFALLIGMSAISHWLGLSEAIGALMAGVILSDTVRPARARGALPQLPGHLRGALLLRLRALDRRRGAGLGSAG